MLWAKDWHWSSLWHRHHETRVPWLTVGPLPLSPNWKECVNEVQAEGELEALRRSGQRGAPFDEELWGKQKATALGLESSFEISGRNRKAVLFGLIE